MTSRDIYSELLAFLDRLEKCKIYYTLAHCREDAVMVQITVPGERWEVEYLSDGTIEVERFKSPGKLESGAAVDELFDKFSD